jgi:ATP-dependent Clp protease ATP-binding subunit ClpA
MKATNGVELSDSVRAAILAAERAAASDGWSEAGSSHLLHALLVSENDTPKRILSSLGVPAEDLQATPEGPGPPARSVLDAAVARARSLGYEMVGAEDVLIALAVAGDPQLTGVLGRYGIDVHCLWRRVDVFLHRDLTSFEAAVPLSAGLVRQLAEVRAARKRTISEGDDSSVLRLRAEEKGLLREIYGRSAHQPVHEGG